MTKRSYGKPIYVFGINLKREMIRNIRIKSCQMFPQIVYCIWFVFKYNNSV